MVSSPGSFFVHVIRRAAARARAGSNQRTFPSTDQTSRARPDRRAYSDTLCRFALTSFRIVTAAAVPVSVRRRNARGDKNEQR